MKIPVSNSEVVDKLSILLIKKDKGLDVCAEICEIIDSFESLNKEYDISEQYKALINVNKTLWYLEDEQRRLRSGSVDYKALGIISELIFINNETRAYLKRSIDAITGSDFREVKSYE